MLRIGVDTGGTFTDFVVVSQTGVRVFKLESTPENPERAVLKGLAQILQGNEPFLVQHGSTVATNALLEGKGARTLLVTNEGFEDILEIGRQSRPKLYDLAASRPQPLIPRRYRLGIKERTSPDGRPLVPLEQKSLAWLKNKVKQSGPEAVAVVLLYSYLNPQSEKAIGEALESAGVPVVLSHQVLPQFREFERTSATVVNAYLTKSMSGYLEALSGAELISGGRLTVMQSNGGALAAAAARAQPIRTLLSGPAGGVLGAFELLRPAGYQKIITFDMGGTSTDVCLCDGEIPTTQEATVGGFPIPVPMIAVHTVGAGGGSIARIDAGGLLRVGPVSAGADPGPICYGKGEQVTVTDANLFLGRIDADFFLGGEMRLSPDRIGPALERLGTQLSQGSERKWTPEEVAEGILQIVDTQMQGAVNLISLQRGYDTRDFTLVSFGGAGGLHACALARSLLIPRVVIPPDPGTLSAMGTLRANAVKDTARTVMLHSREEDLQARLTREFEPLEDNLREELTREGAVPERVRVERSLDVRYAGQAYELNVPFSDRFQEAFHELHERRYGYSNPGLPLEIVNVAVRATGFLPELPIPEFPLHSESPVPEAVLQEKRIVLEGRPVFAPFYRRDRLVPGNRIRGPAVLLEYSSTTLIPEDFEAAVDSWKNLVIEPK